jgi:hypothetical protein
VLHLSLVNQFGLVAGYDGYTSPRDGDLTGIYDFQEVGSSALPSNILKQPSTKSICLGSSANFEVQTDLTQPVFQWQFFNGSDWVDLSDNSIYSNTSSQIMKITPVDNSLNNTSYRVKVAKGGFLCNPAISNTSSLLMDSPKAF